MDNKIDTCSNLGKAIQNTLVTLVALATGFGLSRVTGSSLPAIIALSGCCAWGWLAAYTNWRAQQRVERLERQQNDGGPNRF